MSSEAQRWWEQARRAHPGVSLPLDRFVAHLEALGQGGPLEAFAADLYLACACADGDTSALARFDAELMPIAADAVRRVDRSPQFVEEVLQELRARLFIRTDGASARVAAYAGRGPLAGWLRAAAVRTALNAREARRGPDRNDQDSLADELPASHGNAELELLKKQYGPAFSAALRAALGALNDRDRAVFRMHFIDGLTVTHVAKVLQVDRSTVTRWMSRGRQVLLERILHELQSSLALTPSDAESLTRMLKHQVDISLGALLRESRG